MSRRPAFQSSFRFGLLLCVPLAALSTGACGDSSGGDSDGGAGNTGNGDETLLDPSEDHYGRSNAEWGARWWQWLYELPHESDDECMIPMMDPTGANCAYGQSGDVFFLAGSFAGENIVRDECVIPEGKAIYFPIVSLSADNGGVPEDQHKTRDELEELAQDWVDEVSVAELSVELDGEEIEDLGRFKTDAEAYSYDVPAEPNTYSACIGATGVEGTVEPAFVAGYWMMLAPPEPGAHVLRFTAPGTALSAPVDVTYEFTVE